MTCDGIMDLSRPIGAERVRGFQPPWYTVWRYRCPKCGAEMRIRASRFHGRNPAPEIGGVYCGKEIDPCAPQFHEVIS